MGIMKLLPGRMYLATTDNALILVVAEGAFIAYPDKRCWSHIAIADRAFTIAFIAETSNSDTGLLATHYKITAIAVSLIEQTAEMKSTDG